LSGRAESKGKGEPLKQTNEEEIEPLLQKKKSSKNWEKPESSWKKEKSEKG